MMNPRLPPPGYPRNDRRHAGWQERGGMRPQHPRGGFGRGASHGGYQYQERRRPSLDRDHSPASPSMVTPASPSHDTPLSPDKTQERFTQPKSIPLDQDGVKSIPLERDDIGLSSQQKPKLSEEERKMKLLKLQMKMAGKSSKEISENLSNVSSQDSQQPDSQSSEPSPASRPSWMSPSGPDSPPSLSIAETPMSPEPPASPDTSHQSPTAPSFTPASPTASGPASPDMPDAPQSPDNSEVTDEHLLEIPTDPVTTTTPHQQSQFSKPPHPEPVTRKKEDPRRRDPRRQGKSPPRTQPPAKLSPYDPNLAKPPEPAAPSYMSNIVSSLPQPWQQKPLQNTRPTWQQQQNPRFPQHQPPLGNQPGMRPSLYGTQHRHPGELTLKPTYPHLIIIINMLYTFCSRSFCPGSRQARSCDD